MPICKALLKYGQSSFMVEVMEYCAPDVRFTRETYYLEWLNPKYNIIMEATPFSAETILKMSEKHPRSQKIAVHDLQSSTKIIYSIRHAALALNFNRHTTISYLASGTPYLGRYLFQRVDNFDPLPVNASSSYLEIEAS